MKITLLSADTLQQLHAVTLAELELTPTSPLPGVVRWNDMTFVFAYLEHRESAVYRHTAELVLHG